MNQELVALANEPMSNEAAWLKIMELVKVENDYKDLAETAAEIEHNLNDDDKRDEDEQTGFSPPNRYAALMEIGKRMVELFLPIIRDEPHKQVVKLTVEYFGRFYSASQLASELGRQVESEEDPNVVSKMFNIAGVAASLHARLDLSTYLMLFE